jgi:hypothetical protein
MCTSAVRESERVVDDRNRVGCPRQRGGDRSGWSTEVMFSPPSTLGVTHERRSGAFDLARHFSCRIGSVESAFAFHSLLGVNERTESHYVNILNEFAHTLACSKANPNKVSKLSSPGYQREARWNSPKGIRCNPQSRPPHSAKGYNTPEGATSLQPFYDVRN